MVYYTDSEEETLELARKLAADAREGDVFALNGDLGAGKTVFARGFAQGLGIDAPVTSPTFTILQVYEEGRLPLYHFDIYRISDIMELYDVGFDEYLVGQGVCVIEWADMAKTLLPENTIRITLTQENPLETDKRKIIVERADGEEKA